MFKCVETGCQNEGKHALITLDYQTVYVCEEHLESWLESGAVLRPPFFERLKTGLKTTLNTAFFGFIRSPTATFNQVKDKGWGASYRFFAALLMVFATLFTVSFAVVIWQMLNLVTSMLDSLVSMLNAAGIRAGAYINIQGPLGIADIVMLLVMFLLIIAGGLVGILISSCWMHIWVYLCGGRRGIGQTIKAMAYGSTPLLLLGWIPFVGFIFGLWSMILSIIGIRQLHEISTGRAVLAYLLGAIIMPALIDLMIISVILFL